MTKEVYKLIINLVLKEKKFFYRFPGNKDRTQLKLDILGINQNRFSYINNLECELGIERLIWGIILKEGERSIPLNSPNIGKIKYTK